MGRYLTAGRCPDCQALVGDAARCPVCGLPARGLQAESLRQLLAEADDVLVALRSAAVAPGSSAPAVPPTASVPAQFWAASAKPGAFPMAPLHPVLPPSRTRTFPAISTPVVLLLLGALSVFTAAVVFVTVSWSDLSLAAKAAILLAVTAILGGIASWSVRKQLRGTAETFSALFVIMVLLDFLAARAGGLAGLDALPDLPAAWIGASLMVGTSTAYARAGIRTFGNLVAGQLLAALGLVWMVGLACTQLPGRVEFVALVVGFAALLVTALVARLAMWITASFSLAYAVILLGASLVASIARVVDADTLADLWGHADAAGVLIWSGLFLVAAMVRVGPMRGRQITATLAALGVLTALLRPLEGSDIDLVVGMLVGTALVMALLPVLLRRLPEPWSTASSASAVGPSLAGLIVVIPSAVWGLARIGGALEFIWALDVTDHLDRKLDAFETAPSTPIADSLVMGVAIVALTGATVLIATRRLPSATIVAASVAGAAALALMHYDLSIGVFVVSLGALTACTALAAAYLRDLALTVVASLLGVLTALLSVGSPETTLAVALVTTVVLATVSLRTSVAEAAQVAAGLALAAAAVTIVSFAEVAEIRASTGGDAVAALAGLALLLAQLRPAGRPLRQRLALEVTSLPVAMIGIALSTDDVAWRLPIALTIYGAALSFVALWRTDRRMAGYAGGLLLAVATWVRLAVEDVSIVEAYTLPSALALLIVGLVRMHRTSSPSMLALGPGLSLAFLPSLLVALTEPTSLRALCVGLAGVAAVLFGAVRRWAAPMVFGGVSAGLLLVVNLAPYAQAVPRWVIFAVVGAGLLYLGVTWEHRLRNLRSFALSLERVR
jgi:hypothetical protein